MPYPTQLLDQQQQRAAKNESLASDVTERIEHLGGDSSFVEFVCECTQAACRQTVPLTIEEYDQVRREANQFLVLPGHDVPEVEQVVALSYRHLVVAKRGAGRRIAERLAPRR